MHDLLLANKPSEVEHANCELCSLEGGASKVTTYTAEDVQQAVDTAVADLVAQVAALEEAARGSQVNAQIAQLSADYEAAIAELQSKLDKAQLKKQAAVDELDAFKTELQALADADREAAEIAERTESRIAKVKEVASFPEDYLEENKARFAAMSEDDFDNALKDWAAQSKKTEPTTEPVIPKTSLTASRETSSTTTDRALIRELMHSSLLSDDIKTL